MLTIWSSMILGATSWLITTPRRGCFPVTKSPPRRPHPGMGWKRVGIGDAQLGVEKSGVPQVAAATHFVQSRIPTVTSNLKVYQP